MDHTVTGITKAFHKNGYKLGSFPSGFPGGCRQKRSHTTLLDCIYVELLQTYYVLDLMSWADHPVYDSEFEFRHFWASSKISETPEVQTSSKINKCKFEVLPTYPCSVDVLAAMMAESPTKQVDGMLFYHKHTHYTFGASPLVLWLKPYMMPELLGVPIHDAYLKDAPASYQNFPHHVQTVDREEYIKPRPKRTPKKKDKNSSMDTTACTEGEEQGESVDMEAGDATSHKAKLNKNKRKNKNKTKRSMDTVDCADTANGKDTADGESNACEMQPT